MKKILFSLVVFSLLIGGLTVLAQENDLPSPGIAPDSPFYFLKSWKEQIRLFFTFGEENKVKQFFHLADVRLAEYQMMIDKGKTEIAKRTLEKYEKQLNRAIQSVQKMEKKGKDISGLSRELINRTLTQIVALERSLGRVSEEGRQGVENALNSIRSRVRTRTSAGMPGEGVSYEPEPGEEFLLPGEDWTGREGPSAGGPPAGGPSGQAGFSLPPVDSDRSLPVLPSTVPKGEWVKKQLGDVEISYFSTAIVWGMSENGTDYFITLKNKGGSKATVDFTRVENLLSQIPGWNLHFFGLNDPPLELAAGQEKKLWYFASLDKGGSNFIVKFKVWLSGSPQQSLEIPVTFGAIDESFRNQETSLIYGSVKDEDGRTLSNVNVDALMNCGRIGGRGDSNSQGNYFIKVLAKEDIDAIYQGKDLACESTDYSLSATKDGYEFYFKEHVSPTRSNFSRVDIVLKKKKESLSYGLSWEKQVNDNYGFFWVKPSDDWSVFAASQAKHEPQLGKPTNFYLFSSLGEILWKQPTGNECWGIDIAPDGSKVAAGCHDKKVYVADRQGNLLWQYDAGTMVRSVCLSHDGSKVFSGAISNLYLFNAQSGAKDAVSWAGQWLRNCLFYSDDSGFVVGSRELGGFDISGNQKWTQIIGEFPMFFGTDSSRNVYAAGKSRSLFSYNSAGTLRWTRKIPDHVITFGAVTPNGQRVALGTIGGMVYLFDGQGNLLWKRPIAEPGVQGETTGHNAVAISDDGKRIVVGTAPANCLRVFNEQGTVLWKKCFELGSMQKDLLPGVTNVRISEDKTKIIASYGDNYIRLFTIK